jgi:hypothetical protein
VRDLPDLILLKAVAIALALLLPAGIGVVVLHSLAVAPAKVAKVADVASITETPKSRPLPLLPTMAPDRVASDEAPAPRFDPSYAASPAPDAPVESASNAPPAKPASTLLVRQPAPAPAPKPKPAASPLLEVAVPAPPPRPTQASHLASLASPPSPSPGQFDHFTAIYDLSAHTVYMPDGSKLEAHSGLGDKIDKPQFVDERNEGSTPPHLYNLSLREELFHGVQALRLTPVGGAASIFGRDGILAHSYMLGPNGDSNGCVSFKNYDAFLQAYQSGQVKHIAVVASLAGRTKLASAALDR